MARDLDGGVIPIRTGLLEDHVVAGVAWAAAHYVAWSGDRGFATSEGALLFRETARYWASRLKIEDGRAHIRGVIGPDEYHEAIDDNAFTNAMARWNLRRASHARDATGSRAREAAHWLRLADLLVDGFDPVTRRHEQFSGFYGLEDLVIADLASRRPVDGPTLLGRERVARGQVIKQADVLMLHYLLPDSAPAGSLRADLDYYEPRTAHGSSLSPGVHATLMARVGRPDDALRWLRLTGRIDLDDLSRTTSGGVHLAAMATIWRTLAWGFAGISPAGPALKIDPRPLPTGWRALTVNVQHHGIDIRVRISPGSVHVAATRAIDIVVTGSPQAQRVGPGGRTFSTPG